MCCVDQGPASLSCSPQLLLWALKSHYYSLSQVRLIYILSIDNDFNILSIIMKLFNSIPWWDQEYNHPNYK